MPLANELTETLLNWGEPKQDQKFQLWIHDLHARIQRFKSWSGAVEESLMNIEELFDYAPLDRQIHLMEQQLYPIGQGFDSPSGKAEDIESWMEELEEGLVEVILSNQENADICPVRQFAGQLQVGDVVLTFNYDTLLERAIESCGGQWSHGFTLEDAGPEAVPVLKLHGSIDWRMWSRMAELDGSKWPSLFRKTDLNRDNRIWTIEDLQKTEIEYQYCLYRAVDSRIARQSEEAANELDKSIGGHFAALGGLGSRKPLDRLVGSGEVWRRARWALREAREIYVIGWSCSEYDRLARLYFADTLASRKVPPERIDIVTPHASVNIRRYKSVFKNPRPVDARVEDVNWAEFLSPTG